MITAGAFVIAAAGGAVARALIGRRLNRAGLPLGTVVVNVSGSFALGLVAGVSPPLLTVVATGALGAYTTFSSFARDTAALVEQGRRRTAAAYVAGTCALCVAGAWAGLVAAG